MWFPGEGLRNEGFTLVEILAVFFLFLLTAALVAPRISGSLESQARKRAFGEWVILLRKARIEALERREPIRVRKEESFFIVETSSNKEVVARWEIPAGFVFPDDKFNLGLEFYPLGNSSGGRFEIGIGDEKRSVAVDPVTGEVIVD